MTITTLDGALNGMQPPVFFVKAASPAVVGGRPQSLWGLGGFPGAGAFDTTLAGVALSSSGSQVAGQLRVLPASPNDQHIARLSGQCNQAGSLIVADRLWHNGGFTITSATAQTVNSATFPARDAAGSTNGEGVMLGLEVSAAAGAAAPTITVSYTNSAGVSGRTATNANPTANSPTAGAFFMMALQAGDIGVRSVQSLTLSASWVSGTINLVAFRPLAVLDIPSTSANSIDAITGGFPQVYDGSVPFLIFIPNSTTALQISGSIVFTQG